MSSPLIQALNAICEEKNISKEIVIHTLEAALAAAYRKDYGLPNQNIKVEFDADTGAIKVFDVKVVMEKPPEEEEGAVALEPTAPVTVNTDGTPVEEKPRFNPRLHYTLEEARAIKSDAELEEEIRQELEVPSSYGRMAAQTAKQVIIQKLREAEREVVYNEYKDKEHQVVVGTIGQREGRMILVDIGKITAVMPPEHQLPTESYAPGQRYKVYVDSVNLKTRGAEVIVSRSSPELVRYLFGVEIPEIQHQTVEIMGIAREGGSRTKIAVRSTAPNIDPVGSCVGQRGSRVQTIISEIGGTEKIDIIEFSEDPEEYLKHALSPAKIASMVLNQEQKAATVFVGDDQLSLAIGRGGQNVRLASKLTGWRIDIRKLEQSEAPAVNEDGTDGSTPEAASAAVAPTDEPASTEGDEPAASVDESATKEE